MEFRTLFGELSPIQNRPEAICKKVNKQICTLDHCPLYNCDDEGKICCPPLCDHYTEEVRHA